MNRKELYHKTVDLLLDAYSSGNLKHGDCRFCAVGNICFEASLKTRIPNNRWSSLFYTIAADGRQTKHPPIYQYDALEVYTLIKETGYTKEELMKIEETFELSIIKVPSPFERYVYLEKDLERYRYYTQHDTKKGQYIGLCAVLDVLRDIHETEVQESDKQVVRLKTIATEKYAVVV